MHMNDYVLSTDGLFAPIPPEESLLLPQAVISQRICCSDPR